MNNSSPWTLYCEISARCNQSFSSLHFLQIGMGSSASGDDDYTICRDEGIYPDDIPVPHPLPMPEYGGYFAPLIEYIPESVQASSGFHR